MLKRQSNPVLLFVSTFVSALLVFIGLGMLALLYLPALITLYQPHEEYHPPLPVAPLVAHLPVAEARVESFVEVGRNIEVTPRRPYPGLTVTEGVEAGNWIRIPALDINVPLVMSATMADEDVLKTLDIGAALYPNGIEPGRLGNTFISAHSTGEPWRGKYRFAFLRINELESGNHIHIDYNGSRYTYKMTHSRIVEPSVDFRVQSGRPVPTLTLMACWPLWTTDQRMLIHSELQHITQLTPRPI